MTSRAPAQAGEPVVDERLPPVLGGAVESLVEVGAIRRSWRSVSRRCFSSMPDRASAASSAACDGEARAHRWRPRDRRRRPSARAAHSDRPRRASARDRSASTAPRGSDPAQSPASSGRDRARRHVAERDDLSRDDREHAIDRFGAAAGLRTTDIDRQPRKHENAKLTLISWFRAFVAICMCVASERLSEADEPCRESFSGLPVHLEAEIEANRSEGRLVADAAADRAAQLAEVDVGDVRRTRCRCRGSRRRRGRRRPGARSSALKITSPLPPIGTPSWSSVSPGCGGTCRCRADRARSRGPSCRRRRRTARSRADSFDDVEAGREAEPRVAGEDEPSACAAWSLKHLRREERLHESDLGTDRPRRELAVGADVVARRADRPYRRACRG